MRHEDRAIRTGADAGPDFEAGDAERHFVGKPGAVAQGLLGEAVALALAAFTIAEDPIEGSGFGSASFNSGVLSSAALSSAILGSASFGSADASFGSERLSVGFGSETCAAGVLTGRVGASAGFSGIGMGENVAFGTAGTAGTGAAVATGATGVKIAGGTAGRAGTVVAAGAGATGLAETIAGETIAAGGAGTAGTAAGCTTGASTGAAETGAFTSCVSFRAMPIPVRKVFLACSKDTGLVSTKLAPSRKALGTPALPSTIAIAMETLFRLDARALLNTCVAFCTLSQSTISRSKRCVASRLRENAGSLECSKLTSNSSRIWVTAWTAFSSPHNRNARVAIVNRCYEV